MVVSFVLGIILFILALDFAVKKANPKMARQAFCSAKSHEEEDDSLLNYAPIVAFPGYGAADPSLTHGSSVQAEVLASRNQMNVEGVVSLSHAV